MNNLKLTIGSAALLSALAPTASMGEEQPNILWIVTDDHRADALECYNKATRGTNESALGYVSSPALNEIAAEGVLFTSAYCNSPASAPSRSSMHSGMYPHHRGVYGFEYYHNGLDFTTPTLPEYLREAGYNTTGIGKLGVRYQEYSTGGKKKSMPLYNQFFETKNHESNGGSDWRKHNTWGTGENAGTEYVWYKDGEEITRYYFDRKTTPIPQEDLDRMKKFYEDYDILISYAGKGNEPKPKKQPNTIIGGVSPCSTDYTSDGTIQRDFAGFLASQGKDQYNSLAKSTVKGLDGSQPQLFYLGYHFPHTPVLPTKEFRDKFEGKMYNVPEFDQAEYDKMPAQMQNWYSKTRADKFKESEKQQAIRDYYAFCAMGDSLIGASVKSFKEFCKKNNKEYIILIACGDHSWHLGEQGTYAKFAAYEKSSHTVVIAVSSDKKKFPAGKVYDGYMEYVDILPTLITAAGYDTSKREFSHLDGYNLVDVVSGKAPAREYTIGEIDAVCGPHGQIRTKDFMFGMRTRDISMTATKGKDKAIAGDPNKNMRWAMDAKLEEVDPIFYDLRVDPLERNNVALDPEYRELVELFRKKLGNIMLGDGRVEVDWSQPSNYARSTFGIGSDDKKMTIPESIIPKVEVSKKRKK
ncbi:MAG: sulfatase-like hydrolase/transferase [Rikenellaceae bacterium]